MIDDSEFDRMIANALSPVERQSDEAFIWTVRMAVTEKALARADRAARSRIAGRTAATFALIISLTLVANTGPALNAFNSFGNPAALVMTACLVCFWLIVAGPTFEGDLT